MYPAGRPRHAGCCRTVLLQVSAVFCFWKLRAWKGRGSNLPRSVQGEHVGQARRCPEGVRLPYLEVGNQDGSCVWKQESRAKDVS